MRARAGRGASEAAKRGEAAGRHVRGVLHLALAILIECSFSYPY